MIVLWVKFCVLWVKLTSSAKMFFFFFMGKTEPGTNLGETMQGAFSNMFVSLFLPHNLAKDTIFTPWY